MQTFSIPLPRGRTLVVGERTLVMGILNVTPDSFSDGGRFTSAQEAIDAGHRMLDAGADILDIGGETTRPGAGVVAGAEERARVVPVVEALARAGRGFLSIDTTKALVARAALEAGADFVNDVSGLQYDPCLADVVASAGAGIVLMHMRGRSSDMYREAVYTDVVAEVAAELGDALARARAGGISESSIVLDPGLGFAKRGRHSFDVLAHLDAPALRRLGRPWLVGPSRKSFLVDAIGDVPPADRDWATTAAVTAAVLQGAHIVRVHRVAEMVQVVRVADTIRAARESAIDGTGR